MDSKRQCLAEKFLHRVLCRVIQLSAGLHGHLHEWRLNACEGDEFFYPQAGDGASVLCEKSCSQPPFASPQKVSIANCGRSKRIVVRWCRQCHGKTEDHDEKLGDRVSRYFGNLVHSAYPGSRFRSALCTTLKMRRAGVCYRYSFTRQ